MKQVISVFLITLLLGGNMLGSSTADDINTATAKIMPQVIKWRRFIHEHPELSNREFNTSKLVAEELRKLGIEVRTGIAKTGVVGVLKGGLPGPVVGLRADMDALPVTERTDVPFKSTVKGEYNGQTVGVMHACGHDSHVAMLLGTANVLAGMKDKIKGTVVFIFQPAEEGTPAGETGGAPDMVKEGVMDNPKIDAVFGIHINAQKEIGTITYKSGAFMASSDWFSIKVKGKQTHEKSPRRRSPRAWVQPPKSQSTPKHWSHTTPPSSSKRCCHRWRKQQGAIMSSKAIGRPAPRIFHFTAPKRQRFSSMSAACQKAKIQKPPPPTTRRISTSTTAGSTSGLRLFAILFLIIIIKPFSSMSIFYANMYIGG